MGAWGVKGVTNDQFLMPQDIAIDSANNIFISDVGDAHPEISYIEQALTDNEASTQQSCDETSSD
jgi:hypothetical protein